MDWRTQLLERGLKIEPDVATPNDDARRAVEAAASKAKVVWPPSYVEFHAQLGPGVFGGAIHLFSTPQPALSCVRQFEGRFKRKTGLVAAACYAFGVYWIDGTTLGENPTLLWDLSKGADPAVHCLRYFPTPELTELAASFTDFVSRHCIDIDAKAHNLGRSIPAADHRTLRVSRPASATTPPTGSMESLLAATRVIWDAELTPGSTRDRVTLSRQDDAMRVLTVISSGAAETVTSPPRHALAVADNDSQNATLIALAKQVGVTLDEISVVVTAIYELMMLRAFATWSADRGVPCTATVARGDGNTIDGTQSAQRVSRRLASMSAKQRQAIARTIFETPANQRWCAAGDASDPSEP